MRVFYLDIRFEVFMFFPIFLSLCFSFIIKVLFEVSTIVVMMVLWRSKTTTIVVQWRIRSIGLAGWQSVCGRVFFGHVDLIIEDTQRFKYVFEQWVFLLVYERQCGAPFRWLWKAIVVRMSIPRKTVLLYGFLVFWLKVDVIFIWLIILCTLIYYQWSYNHFDKRKKCFSLDRSIDLRA